MDADYRLLSAQWIGLSGCTRHQACFLMKTRKKCAKKERERKINIKKEIKEDEEKGETKVLSTRSYFEYMN